MPQEYKLTQSGLDELKQERDDLQARRKNVAEKLKTAREFGDLSENAEYHAAREEQVQVESRLSEIDNILKNVKVIESPNNKTQVELGNTVVLKSNGTSRELTIVGSVEANPTANKVSDESPIGQALLGKKVKDEVEIKTPSGTTLYTVKEIK